MTEVEPGALPEVLWTPPEDAWATSRLGQYASWLTGTRGLQLTDYDSLRAWSVAQPGEFWRSVGEYFGVLDPDVERSSAPALDYEDMVAPTWFPGRTFNYAETMLRLPGRDDQDPVLLGWSQSRDPVTVSAAELRDQVRRARAGLVSLGVRRSDRVVAYAPNVPETLVLLLACASLGAVFSSCAPEFGVRSVCDRWSQIEPTVLLAVDGYRYGAKAVDRRDEVAQVRAALPTLRATVWLPYLDPDAPAPECAVVWADLLAAAPSGTGLVHEPLPFDHPLYVLYSSGTTGLPKPIVHGHGGIVLEHLKALALQLDLGPADRFFWFTTTGWMMWNLLVSGIGVGATVVMFDGDPGHPDLGTLWRLVEATGTTFFGTSAPFLLACRKAGLHPAEVADTSSVRTVGSTGAPLPRDGFRWVATELGGHVAVNSLSGGTDVCTAFVGGVSVLPVRAGEMAARLLGCAVEAWDPDGRPVVDEVGELVLTRPMPSMPVGFWGDADRSRYREAYFEHFPGVWRHGDWVTITSRGSCVIHGRSDATLNRGGVRLGTAEFYALVEELPEVADSLVVHLEDPEGGPGELLLFVVPAAGVVWDVGAEQALRRTLRERLSPRHVPDAVHAVTGVPRTLSGKKLEVPAKKILQGTPVERAAAAGALANPESLAEFVRVAHRRAAPPDQPSRPS